MDPLSAAFVVTAATAIGRRLADQTLDTWWRADWRPQTNLPPGHVGHTWHVPSQDGERFLFALTRTSQWGTGGHSLRFYIKSDHEEAFYRAISDYGLRIRRSEPMIFGERETTSMDIVLPNMRGFETNEDAMLAGQDIYLLSLQYLDAPTAEQQMNHLSQPALIRMDQLIEATQR